MSNICTIDLEYPSKLKKITNQEIFGEFDPKIVFC